jgi:UDP-N-acetyl-2-amino-2-deoxyglucuronate dehydrogenase
MRIAIIGAGTIGAVHAKLIASLQGKATLVAVVDTEFDRATSLAAQYGAQPYRDLASAFAAEEIDSVSVCLPSALHTDAAVEALAAGKHVLIEKPIAVTMDAADRILEAEKASGRTVAVISQRRFQPTTVFIKKAIDEGRLGRVTSGIAESAFFRSQAYYDSGDWRGTVAIDGGGALMNQGIHALDLLIWMLGTPVQVSAQTGQIAHERIEVEDVAAATILFENGSIGVLLASTAAYPGLPVRLAVHGDKGIAVMDDDELAFFSGADAAGQDTGGAEQDAAAVRASLVEPEAREGWSPLDHAHRAQYEDFIDGIAQNRAPRVSTQAGRRALAVVLAVYESARTGRPVELKEV